MAESPHDADSGFPLTLQSFVDNRVGGLGSAEEKRGKQMTKQKGLFGGLAVFVFSLFLPGCYNLERSRLEAELERTKRERDDFRARLDVAEQWPEQADEVPVEAADAPSQLQQQIDEFIRIRDSLQQREDELTRLRQAALAEAQTAQALMDNFAAQLQAEMEKVNELQNELERAQQAITVLQQKLE